MNTGGPIATNTARATCGSIRIIRIPQQLRYIAQSAKIHGQVLLTSPLMSRIADWTRTNRSWCAGRWVLAGGNV